MCKRVIKLSGLTHFQKQIGDADIRKLPVKIKDEFLCLVRYAGFQSFDLERAILDSHAKDGSCGPLRPEQPTHVRSYDFALSRTVVGRAYRTLNIIEEDTRGALMIRVDRKLSPTDVLDELTDLLWPRASLSTSAEVDERYVQKQLGHTSAEMTRRHQRRRDRSYVNLTKVAGL